MKKLITILSLSIAVGLSAKASDQLQNEIVCRKVQNPGEADSGLSIVLKSNSIAWNKVIAVYENGYLGERLIANIQVPLQPQISGANRGGAYPLVNIVYGGQGITVAIQARAIQGFPLTGEGYAFMALPGYTSMQAHLRCVKVR